VSIHTALATFRGHRQPHFNIVGRARWWFLFSGSLILLAFIGLFVRNLNFSLDFEGGALIRYANETGVGADDVTSVLTRFGRPDAEVQIVAGAEGADVIIRTTSLSELGGPPQLQLTYPNESGVDPTEIRSLLATYGIAQPRVTVTEDDITVVTVPFSDLANRQVAVLSYVPGEDVEPEAVERRLANLNRAGTLAMLVGDTMVVFIRSFEATVPSPSPSPAPSATPSPGASPSPDTTASPDATATPSATASPDATPSPDATATPSATPSPDATPSPGATASPGATPTPSPAPAPAGREDVVMALANQAGIEPRDVTVRELSEVDPDEVVTALAEQAGIEVADVRQRPLGGDQRARLLQGLAEQAGIGTADINIQDVGPTWGAQISKKALQGLIIFLILVTVYITFRYEWKMSAAALIAMFHDLIITAGLYALVGREVTPETVIAILTILGYSLYDTVVIFDRVKENTDQVALVNRETYSGVVNLSLNEVLMRSVNTSLVVMLPILALLLFGGETLKDFAFALFVGVVSGAYSSVFIASPALALLKEREPRFQSVRERAARIRARPAGPARVTAGRPGPGTRPGRPALTAVPPAGPTEGDGVGEASEPTTTAQRKTPQRPGGQRPRPKTKRKTPAAKRRRR
jgi:preprotein translocase subunit SecF